MGKHTRDCGHDHSKDIATVIAIWKMCVAYAGKNVNDFTDYLHQNGVEIPRDVVGDDLLYTFDLTANLGHIAVEEFIKSQSGDIELDLSNLLRGN